jgi:hypothetical protein
MHCTRLQVFNEAFGHSSASLSLMLNPSSRNYPECLINCKYQAAFSSFRRWQCHCAKIIGLHKLMNIHINYQYFTFSLFLLEKYFWYRLLGFQDQHLLVVFDSGLKAITSRHRVPFAILIIFLNDWIRSKLVPTIINSCFQLTSGYLWYNWHQLSTC